jgi:uncharacterized protein involved in cysteine biosynthesis
MLYARATAIIGFILIFLPFLGLPTSWKEILFVLIGVILMYIGFLEYRLVKNARKQEEEKTRTYTENSIDSIRQQ